MASVPKQIRDPGCSVLQPLALQSPGPAVSKPRSTSSVGSVGSSVTRCSSTSSANSLSSFGSDRSRDASVPSQKSHSFSSRVSISSGSRLRHGDLPYKYGWLGLRVGEGMSKRYVDRYVELAGAYIIFAASPNTDIMASCYQIYKASVTSVVLSSSYYRIDVKTEAGERLVLLAESSQDYHDWLNVLHCASKRHINNHYVCHQVQASSIFGRIASARDLVSHERVSVRMTSKADLDDMFVSVARRECLSLISLTSLPTVARIIDMYETAATIYCVTEYIPPANSIRQLVQGRRPFSERDTSFVMHSLLKTLSQLHESKICHRSCTPDAVHLVDPACCEKGIKLTSFELAVHEHDAPRDIVSLRNVVSYKGSDRPVSASIAPYIAPEILKERPGGFSQDSWAAGVLMHYMLVAATPFDGPGKTANDALAISTEAVGMPSFRGVMWAGISRDAMDLCAQLLHADPRRRLSPRDALRHRWFRFNS